ncbi:transposase [Nguyenibacter vanlangensis]|uniref:Transposase n=1 Tax=Nguyenibacter vanlangensis TaxID=1216886 RepID=A0ABZ3D9E2_9PROT
MKYGEVSGRKVVADFGGGTIISDAGAQLLGAADRALGLTERFARCFTDARASHLVEHDVHSLVLPRVAGIALGYEDLVDHDHLRHGPVLATLAG